jgi:UDP-N-acetyl-D-mannosaminuronate dehydrogenase
VSDKTMKNKTVCIIGLGYVGLPLANAFMIENKSVKWVMGDE